MKWQMTNTDMQMTNAGIKMSGIGELLFICRTNVSHTFKHIKDL